jgi:hypothetical protein
MLARILSALAVMIAAVHGWRFVGYICDDAVISFRSVLNFGQGHGLVYNVGEQVETFTNLGFVFLLVVAQAFGCDLFVAAGWLGWASAVGAVWATWWLAREVLPDNAAWVPPLVVATSTTLIGQAGTGLETSTAALFVTLGLARLLRECRSTASELERPRPGLGLLLLAIAALVRIDCVLVLGGAWFLKLLWCGPAARRTRAIDTGVFALGLVLPTLFRLVYYGSPVPNPVLAKFGLAPDVQVYKSGVNYLLEWLRTDLGPPVLVAGLAIALLTGRRVQAMVVLCGGWLFYILTSGGDHMPYHRFVAPMLPALVTATIVGWQHVFARSGLLADRLGTAAIMLGILVMAAGPQLQSMSRGNIPARSAVLEAYRRELGEFFAARAVELDRRLIVAGGAAGYMGHFAGSQVRFIDILGLTDEHIAAHGRRDPRMPPGHRAGDGVYVLAQRPDYVVFGSSTPGDLWQRDDSADLLQRIAEVGPEAWAKASDHLWAVSERELLAAPEFHRDYEFVQVELGSGRRFRLCRRRD